MFNPDQPQPQPQPVLNWATAAAAASALVAAIGAFIVYFGGATDQQVSDVAAMTLRVVTALGVVVSIAAPLYAAHQAAKQVTPLSSPRTDVGEPLRTAAEWEQQAATYGQHASVSGGSAAPYVVTAAGMFQPAAMTRGPDTQEMPAVTNGPRRPLGRLKPTGAPRVKLTASMVAKAALNPPPYVDWYSKVPASSWGVDGNDAVGDCTCAEVDHSTKARQVAAGNPEVHSTDAEVLALYSAVTGYDPRKPSSDQGAVMQDVRDYWRKHGVTLGGKLDKILLFAAIDHTDLSLVKWCVDRFGAVGLGINFPASAMDQFDAGQPWSVVKGAPIEGGHAISMVGYDSEYAYIVTWGRVVPMTWAFFEKYVEEAWTDLSEDFVNSVVGGGDFAEALYQLGQQFSAVTGQPNPIPQPSPAPAPEPGPTPQPAPAVSEPPATVAAWAQHTLKLKDEPKYARTGAQDYLDWLKAQH